MLLRILFLCTWRFVTLVNNWSYMLLKKRSQDNIVQQIDSWIDANVLESTAVDEEHICSVLVIN